MRVVMPLACYCPWIGGAEVFAQRLAEDLVSKRYEVEVVTGWWSGKRGVEKEEVIGGVRVSRVRPVVNWRFVKTLSWTWPGYQKSLEVISAKREAQSTKHKIGIDD